MKKKHKSNTLQRIQCAARYIRTTLAFRLTEIGLYPGQDMLLLLLAQEDGQSPSLLARRLHVKPPTVTKMIMRLQAQGFVTKKASDDDLRQSFIFLTKNGYNAIQDIEKAVKKTEKDVFRGFDPDEQRNFLMHLNRLEGNLSGAVSIPRSSTHFDMGDEAVLY